MKFVDLVKSSIVVFLSVVILWFTGAQAEELRRVEVIGFDFAAAEVLLQDEDGYVWTCPFGENSWAVGEEYLLVIDGENVDVEEV